MGRMHHTSRGLMHKPTDADGASHTSTFNRRPVALSGCMSVVARTLILAAFFVHRGTTYACITGFACKQWHTHTLALSLSLYSRLILLHSAEHTAKLV